MSGFLKLQLSTATVWLIRILGLLIFAIAFFLPAVGLTPNDNDPLIGWRCATIALSMPFSKDVFDLDMALVTLSGWLNPFLFFYLVFSFFKRLKILRYTFATFVLLSMLATWIFFIRAHYIPLIGHYLWILGALTVMLPEFFGSKQEG
jgi:hypothetical protein